MSEGEFAILMAAIADVRSEVGKVREEVNAIKIARAEEQGARKQTRFLANMSKETLALVVIVAGLISGLSDVVLPLLTGHK